MTRKKLAFGFGALVILWLGVSTYFYVHHYVTIKTCPVYEKVDFGDKAIYITELRWVNWERDTDRFLYNSDLPWYYKLIESKHIPLRMAMAFIKVPYFYSTPYIKYDDNGYLTVKGLILRDVSDRLDDYSKRFKISLHASENLWCSSSEWGMHMSEGSNISSFYQRDKTLIPADEKYITIDIKDTRTDILQTIRVYPEWQSEGYSFFDQKPDEHEFAAETTAINFMKLVQSRITEKAEQMVLTNLQPTFPWDRLEHEYLNLSMTVDFVFYEGNYGGYSDVFSCKVIYVPEGSSSNEPAAAQNIYLIHHENEWKVIDISPVAAAE